MNDRNDLMREQDSSGPTELVRPEYRRLQDGPAAMRSRRADVFQVALIFLLISVAFLIPSRLIFDPLGAAGRPVVIVGVGLAFLVSLASFRKTSAPRGRQPLNWAIGIHVLIQTIAYAVGIFRGLSPLELRSADRWMIVVFAMSGIALFVSDFITSWSRLRRLGTVLTVFGGITAFFGMLQFFIGFDVQKYVKIPGLTANFGLLDITSRGDGIVRIAGMMSHFIEFGVVLALIVPLGLHYALYATTTRERILRWGVLILMLSAIPMSVSRSGLVALLVGLIFMSVVWSWRLRFNALVAGAIGLTVFRAISPGVLGTLRSLFAGAENDPSVMGRTEDYEIVFPLIWERPIFGRGAGTFLPEKYILLDNQYLNTWVSSGILGLLAVAGLFLCGYGMARSMRRRAQVPEQRAFAQALAASVLAAAVASSLFDSFAFYTFSTVLFLLLGFTGALWRVSGVHARAPAIRDKSVDARIQPPLLPDLRGR